MDWARVLLSRCKAHFGAAKLDADLDEELRTHIDLAVEESMKRGLSRDDARQAALREFGSVSQIAERYRTGRGLIWLDTLARDVRFALWQVRKAPGFAVSTVLTLALGIGTATVMFAIVYGVMLEPLPFANDRRLYQPIGIYPKGNEDPAVPYATIQQWQDATRGKAEIAFSSAGLAILDAPAGAQLITNVGASANLLPMLGVQPIFGRQFSSQEIEDGQSNVVLLSYGLWQQAFSADPGVLGRTLHIESLPYTVIGVMPPRFVFPVWDDRPEVWTLIPASKLQPPSAPTFYTGFQPLLRVRSGSSVADLRAQLSSVQQRIARSAKPGDEQPTGILLVRLHDSLVAGARPALTGLEIAVALVWLIACCNVAGLLLARIAARRAEIAVRGALGAGRLRIALQFLTESLLLSSTGALAGIGLAMLTLQLFRRMLEKALPLARNVQISWPVCAALAGLTVLTGVVFGFFPAMIAAGVPIEQSLKTGGRTASASRGQSRLRSLLLVSEIALSTVLLVGASLMMRTIYALHQVPLGFRTDHIVLTDLTVPSYAYRDRDLNIAAWKPLLDLVSQMPGIDTAALSTVMPIGHRVELLTVVYATPWTKGNVSAVVRAASPDLMRVLGIRMRSGRFFTAADTADSMPVAVVNRAFAEQYLGGSDALGKQIQFGRVRTSATVVGVLEDVHQDTVADPSHPEFYACMSQLRPDSALYTPLIGRNMQLAVRTQTAPEAMISELHRAIHEENPNLASGEFTTMNQAVEDSIGNQRLASDVIGVFAGLSLLITIAGLHGLLSYSVTQRTQEIGIRMALGADRSQVMNMVLRQALALLAFGAIVGIVPAICSSRLLNSFLYGVNRYDQWTLLLVPVVLIVIGILAAFIPARRAASIDPTRVLRGD
jgi:putative ABC transport system permease protein